MAGRVLRVLVLGLLGCSGNGAEPAPVAGSGGATAGATGSAMTGGAGSASTWGGAGGSGTVEGGSGQTSAGAPSATGGAGTNAGGDAGTSSAGGSAGTSSAGGTAGGPATAPSSGCGKAGRPAQGTVTVAGDHIYVFPEKYEGTKPFPVLFALHAYGNPYTQLRDLTNGSALATDYVRVFPKSAGAGWVLESDAPRLDRIFEELREHYCIDERRVFLTGHSSGAQMAVQLLCSGDRRFRAAAPVAASRYCQAVDPIPVLYIQGKMDAQRGGGNGKDVVDVFAKSNGCAMASEPLSAIASCQSKFDQATVTPGCVAYQGCDEPTVWCSHDDNGYNATDGRMHGWPCFASAAMAWFFASLP